MEFEEVLRNDKKEQTYRYPIFKVNLDGRPIVAFQCYYLLNASLGFINVLNEMQFFIFSKI